jgi:hypothetical protein
MTRADWKKLEISSLFDEELALAPTDNEPGWYMPLDPGDAGGGKYPEYVTTKPIVVGGTLYVSTFLGSKIDVENGEDLCGTGTITGDSRIYAVDLGSGAANKWESGGKYLTLENAKITGLTHTELGNKDRVLVTYNKLSAENNLDGLGDKSVSRVKDDALDMLAIDASYGGGGINMPSGSNVINYWNRR